MKQLNMAARHSLSLRTPVSLLGAIALLVASAFFLIAAPAPGPALADVEVEELMKEGPLPDQALGSPDAPVTVVEYASLTCSHCADFHANVYPGLKEKYIETGKVRYILREFPLNNQAFAAAALARCLDDKQFFPFIDALFKTQETWSCQNCNVEAELKKLWKQAGGGEEQFKQCLDPKTNKAKLDAILAIRKRGSDEFKVDATPTLFVNGERLTGINSIEQLDKALEPHLKGS